MREEFPGAMGEALLDGLFSEMTGAKLLALLSRPPGPFGKAGGKLVLHVLPANVPNPGVTSVTLGLLARSANAVKVSKRDAGLLRVYLESLRAHDASLAGAVSVFSSHRRALEFAPKAALVIVYGSDETVRHLRRHASKKAVFLGYGHRVSVAVFAKEALGNRAARAAAYDAWMVDRRGCMSPDVFFAEEGGKTSPRAFAAAIRVETEKLRGVKPSFARALRLRAAQGRERIRAAKGETLSADAPVRAFRNVKDLLKALSRYRGKLQVVAVEGPPSFRRLLAAPLRRLGAARVCRAGRMQRPPLSWDHEKSDTMGR